MKLVKEVKADILLAPDVILRYLGNEFVGPSDNRAQINDSKLEEGRKVGDPVSARTRAKRSKLVAENGRSSQCDSLSSSVT